jgi:hypothetical protein
MTFRRGAVALSRVRWLCLLQLVASGRVCHSRGRAGRSRRELPRAIRRPKMSKMSAQLKKLALVVTVIASFGAVSSAAMASVTRVVLNAPKSAQVNYTNCTDPFGNPAPCVTVDFAVVNNTAEDATCQLYSPTINFTLFSGTLRAGQTLGGELTTPYTAGMRSLKLVLSCDGSKVPGQTQKVRVIYVAP